MIAVSNSIGESTAFFKIQFEDFSAIQELIQGLKPTNTVPLSHKLPTWPCKKPRSNRAEIN